ncbi:hypothetical protein [Variovorax sp. W2I14]|uniref:hypothetical protein n=1 Tax=Variovorax sp. W2I14 TaxID=3042290 RepID=UPI003D1977D5
MPKPIHFLRNLVVLFASMGAIDCLMAKPGSPSPLAVVYALVFAALVFGWCKAHAAARGNDPPAGAAIMAAFLAPIGVPLYFLRSMPVGQALWSSAKALLFFAGLLAIHTVTAMLFELLPI